MRILVVICRRCCRLVNCGVIPAFLVETTLPVVITDPPSRVERARKPDEFQMQDEELTSFPNRSTSQPIKPSQSTSAKTSKVY